MELLIEYSIGTLLAGSFFFWMERRRDKKIRALERAFIEKDRLLDDQMAALSRLLKSVAAEKDEMARVNEVMRTMLEKVNPLVEHLGKVY